MTVDELLYWLQKYVKGDEHINNYRVIVRYEGEELNIKGPISLRTDSTLIIDLRK